MKRIFLILLGILAFFSCQKNVYEEEIQGLSIKSYMPTTVIEGLQMTISGSAFDEVKEIVFPDNISVNNFELVTKNMIRVVVPKGVAKEGGVLKLVTANSSVESKVKMRIAAPKVKSLDPGDEVEVGGELSFVGEDLECITNVLIPAEDGTKINIEAMNFLRKSSDNIKIIVPQGIMSGINSFSLVAANGQNLSTPEVNVRVAPKDPAGTVVCNITQVASGYYITRNTSLTTPMIMKPTGGNNQKFKFMPIPNKAYTYYLWNFETGEYLTVGEENDWRMGWVADPTSVSNPEKAQFQVVPVEGDPNNNVFIRVLGSKYFGTDSTDDNSEIYSDKNNDISNERNLWRIEIISGTFDEGWNIVWEGESTYNVDDGGWMDQFVDKSAFIGLKVGQIMRMHFRPVEGYTPQIDLRDGNDQGFDGYNWVGFEAFDTYPLGYIDIPVTEYLYDRVFNAGDGGFHFRGFWYILTKVELVNG